MTFAIGKVRNSATTEISFPFYSGVAGVRTIGDGLRQVAFPAARLATIRGEGTIDGDRYVVEGAAAPSTTAGLVTMTVRRVADDSEG